MKRTIALLLTTAMLTSSAFAFTEKEHNVALGAAGVISYDKTCERVSHEQMYTALLAKQTIPEEAYSVAAQQLFEAYAKVGKAVWCAKVKEIING